jgi:GT2 family glycosyltransferase
MYPRVSIHIVAWNSMDFLPELMASIAAQTYRDFTVLVIDNASTDGVEPWMRQHHPRVSILRNVRNLGFSPAHNQAIRYALDHWAGEDLNDRFVLVTNPDVILSPTFLETILKEPGAFPQVGSFTGKLLRAHVEHADDDALKETMRSDRIDSTGLVAHRNRTFTDRGAGELDQGQYDQARDVFGVSGALALYRASALQEARYRDEFFDQDFFAYKEDVDLAWRLRLLGWGARYVPGAVAHHHRNMYGAEKIGFIETIKNRMKKSKRRSFFSNRNHWSMYMKNELLWNAFLSWPFVKWMEFKRVVYTAIFEPTNLRAFWEAITRTPRMLAKRSDTMKKRKATASDMRAWFV